MAHSQNSMELPININATQITTAYGHRALPKLKEELQSEDLQTRQKALMALCDLMHDPECIYKAMNIGCMENLKALLKDSNSVVRIKTTEVLYITASHSVGRYAFLEHDIVLALSFLLNDPSPVCRGNLYKAYMQLVQQKTPPLTRGHCRGLCTTRVPRGWRRTATHSGISLEQRDRVVQITTFTLSKPDTKKTT
ncbi:RSPH14 isoform 3 [Pongo abelii]|uniref:RSPH14 isoform 3 n=1 Tax=Pongo abelii TaxID=9601 RepID=A0A2J8RZ41_PONAB|nr:RSPH14 isoform 3 [Pongo abelii]